MENNHSMSRVERSRREKVTRYSVRKVSFGAASVAVAAFFMFLGNGAVYAAEPNVTATDSALAATPANNQLDENSGASDSTAPKAQADTTTPTPTDSSSTSVESSTVSKAKADTTTSKPADATPAPVVSSTTSAIEEKSAEKNTEASSAEANSVENKQQTTVKAEEPSTTSVATTKPAEETATTESSKPKLRKKRAADPSSTMDTTSDEAANQVYTAPEDSANVDDLATKLKDLPETVENEKKLDKIDEVGATKNITPGQVSDLNEFGGWKAVNGGKFGVARKTANGVFPIETVNTVRTNGSKDKTWLNESSFDRSNSYALFLGLVRTAATSNERVDDGSLYTQGIENSNKGKGLENYRGIEKTFKNYSLSTGSDVTISFRTGFTGDIDGHKAGYKVEVITKTVDGINNTIYNQSFYPQNSSNNQPTINDENKIVTPVKVGGNAFFETDRSQTENKKYELTKKLEEESNKGRLGTSHGTFTSKKISLAPGVTEYTVRISAADNSKLGMGFQVPWKQYALPVVGNGFAVTQDTSKVAKDLAKKVYDKLTEQKEKDTKWSTPETKAVYEAKLQKIKDALNSDTSTTASYKTVAEDAVAQQKKLNEKEQIKKKANDAVTAKLTEKEQSIEDNGHLSPTEKSRAKEQAREEASKANRAITGADSQTAVTTAQTTGEADIQKVNPVGKEKAKKAIQDELAKKLQAINDNDKLSQAEKDTAKADATAKAQAQTEAIDKQPANADTADKANEAQTAVTTAQTTGEADIQKVNPVGKEKAKKAIQDELAKKLQAINDNDKLSQAEKDTAKADATAKAQAQTEAIDKQPANADTADKANEAQTAVTTAQTTGEADIQKVNPVGKEKAKKAIQDELAKKLQAINDNDKLSQAEKDTAKADATAKAQAQTEAIDKQPANADTADKANEAQTAVTTAQTTGEADIQKVNPVGKEKAKKAIQDELAKKLQAINDNDKLSQAEKDTAKADATAKAQAQTEAIDKQPANADTADKANEAQTAVTTAQTTGEADIQKVNPVGKEKAKKAIQDELAKKLQAINDNDKLSQAEKDTAKADATAKAQAQTEAIDKQPANADTADKANEAQTAVTTAQTTGEADIQKVNPVGKEKAKKAIQDELAKKLQAINDNDKLSQAEKDTAKADATAKAQAQTEAIDKQPANADTADKANEAQTAVTTAQTTGEADIQKVNPVGKEKAKKAIQDELAKKLQAINDNDKLSQAEKDTAKADATAKAQAQTEAIDKQPANADTADKANEAQTAVTTAQTTGEADIQKVNPVGKDKAKAAVDAALAEKDKAIDANDKLSDAEKSAAKDEAKKAADEAKKAIDAAADQSGVDAKATEGTEAVAAVNPVGKDKAKAAVDAALAEKDKAIDANDKLSDAEKSAAKDEAKKAADEAKKAIDAAADQSGVDAKATEGTEAVAAVNPVGKDKAKAAVDAALAEKDKAIDANDKLSDAEKSAAKDEAKKAADEAKKAIDAAADQSGVDAKATEGTEAVAAVNPVGKDKAKAAVDAALAEKDKAIDANDKLSDAEKSAAKDEAKKAADEAKKAIDAAADQSGVDAKATEGTEAVAAVNPVGKDKAKAAVDAALAEKDKAIDANDKLSDAEKSAAKDEAKKAADEAKKAIDAAADQSGVDAKATEGTEAVAAVNPVGKDKAKAAVDAALAEKDKAIDANDKLSDAEKSAAKDEAKKAADEAKKAIDAAADQSGVDAKATEGTEAVAAVNPVGKDKAKAAVDAALAEKDKAIDANDKLSDAEKSAAKDEAKKAADEAKKAIDAAADQSGVDAKATEGTEAVAAVNPVGKDKAKAAVDAALAEKDKAIDANDKLSDAEKSAAKDEAKKAADEAKKAIDAAADQSGVDAKATEGTEAVAAVNPVGKDKAKAAVDAALAEKDKAIDANDKLSDAEKSAAKDEAKKAADEAKKAIDAAADQSGVDAKATEGTEAVAAVNPVGKDKAKAAVDAALAEKDKAIDANDKLSDAEKSAAKDEAKKAADEAKKAIDAAADQSGVDAKATEGTEAVAAVNPVGKDKAKAAVDAALAEKDKAIDANDKLSDAEKSAAKDEAKKAADEAKKAIDAAADQSGVDAKATEGTEAVAAVNPVGKDKAKAAVDAALAEKDKAIDANDKLSDAEKSAAKDEAKKAADEAKKAIDAAADQSGVDAKATEGTEAVAAVNPVGKDKAKAAVDAALAEKDKAIDANDKLSDAEKSAAKDEAKKAADEAKKAIDAAADQSGVDAKATEGTEAVAAVNPVGKDKAKAAVDAALAEKDKAIDANDKLSDAEKSAAKAQVAAEAKKAIEAIEKATTEADVEAAKEAGKAEIAKVAPATTDYKAKAKAEVEAELAKKLAELENATDLTEAEKAAAKAQVVNKAKEAIEAIQKAATEADVDQAIRNFVYRISAVIREQEEYDLSKLFVNGSVTVKQGESLTDKDVLSKLNLPSGVEIVKVEKPTTSALGTVMAKVTVKLADGSVEEINVPVEVIVSQNHGNEGNGANNGATNTDAKADKAKLEGAIHQLDELIIKESAKLDAETAKEANDLLADAKKVFANADASQAEVDAMVKRIEDFMAKVAPLTDHANTANDQSAQTPAVVPANNQSAQTTVVAPATTQAAANASQILSAQANARKAAKELPNTGTADSTVAMVAAAASALLGLGLAGRRRKEDEEA